MPRTLSAFSKHHLFFIGKKFLLISLCLFAFVSVAAQEDKEKQITLLFTGDLMQHQSQLDAAKRCGNYTGYDYSDCFSLVKKELSNADLTIGNLETTLAGRRYAGYPMFCAPDSYLYAIQDAGFDVLLTANNHCLDRGKSGLLRTNKMLDSLHIYRCGTYADTLARQAEYPLLIEQNGFRIVLLNYTYGTNGLDVPAPVYVNFIDTVQLKKDITKAKFMCPDILIACMHWGEEYRLYPEKSQRELAEWLIEQGVDHVIGSHPHVLQPMEVHVHNDSPKKHLIVYSLGNYISGMFERYKDGGAMVKMTFKKDLFSTEMTDCSYSLVWNARPLRDDVPNFMLYPAANPPDSLPKVTADKLNEFLNDSRLLFQKNNIGIQEYEFLP